MCVHLPAGTLISHEKLLLQINTERELGNMDYKLGQVSIHSVWLGNNITPLREEEWGEDEEDETDAPAPTSPPTAPIHARSHTHTRARTHTTSPPTSPINSRSHTHTSAAVHPKGAHACMRCPEQVLNPLPLSSSSLQTGSIEQGWTSTRAPSSCWSSTASGSSPVPLATGRPLWC